MFSSRHVKFPSRDVFSDEGCGTFVHETSTKVCELYRQREDQFLDGCFRVGGPREPDAEECGNSQVLIKKISRSLLQIFFYKNLCRMSVISSLEATANTLGT